MMKVSWIRGSWGTRAAGVLACLLSLAAPHAAIAMAPAAPPVSFKGVAEAQLDAAAAARLEQLRSKSGSWGLLDLIDRGRIAVAQGEFETAAAMFEVANKSATTDAERVATRYCFASALIVWAQSLPDDDATSKSKCNQKLSQAGTLLDQAQRIMPQSRDIAAARVTAWSLLGDRLRLAAAEHQLRVIDPTQEGTARCSAAVIGTVVVVVCKLGKITLEKFDFKGYLTPDQRLMLLKALDTGARVGGYFAPAGPWIDVFDTEAFR